MITSVELEFCPDEKLATVFNILLNAGWTFAWDKIQYNYCDQTSVFHQEPFIAQVSEWLIVSALLQEKIDHGLKIFIELECRVLGLDGTFMFGPELHAVFYGGLPRLYEGSQFTDFSPLLSFIVVPIEKAGICIFEARCIDHND